MDTQMWIAHRCRLMMTLDLGAVSDLQSLLNTTTIKKNEPIESDCFCFHDFIFDDDDGDGANDGAE